MNWIEIVAVVLALAAVWLTVRQNIWCWPLGSAGNVLFGYTFFQALLYSDAALQVIYIALNSYGWYQWLYGGQDRTPLFVTRTSRRAGGILAAIGLAGTAAMGAGLDHYTDTDVPCWDAMTTALSLIAQYMLTKKLLENWFVWITANALYIGLYLYKGLYWTSALQVVFIALSIMGFLEWQKQRQKVAAAS